jgi:cytoskeletal protein RodZ
MPTMHETPMSDRSGASRRDTARGRVRRTSRAVAVIAAGAAAGLGLLVSKQIPGTTSSAATTVTSSPSTSTTSAGTDTDTDSATASTTAPATSPTTAPTTVTTTAPTSTTKAATVVSGGTGR